MSELFLIRHAQASFGTDDYDRLSTLGLQQSAWLGSYIAEQGIHFDKAFAGSLLRQQQTANTLLETAGQPLQLHSLPTLNEFDFHTLGALYCQLNDLPLPQAADGPKPFFQMLRQAIQAWSAGHLHTEPVAMAQTLETWEIFSERARTAIQTLAAEGDSSRLLAVSSGGLIAMILMQALECSVDAMINLNMQIRNTGISRLVLRGDRVILSSFNAVPHLEQADRRHAISYA